MEPADHSIPASECDAVYDTAPPLIFALIRENERDQRRLDRLAARNLRRELSYVKRIQAARVRVADRHQ